MKIEIEIPKEFEEHFNNDRFNDSLEDSCWIIECAMVSKYPYNCPKGSFNWKLNLSKCSNAMTKVKEIKE